MSLVNVKVDPSTKESLREIKEKLQKIFGRKFTYDDTVNFLISLLVDEYVKEVNKRVECEQGINVLEEKRRLIEAFYPIVEKPFLKEVVENYYYIPDFTVKAIKDVCSSVQFDIPKLLLAGAVMKRKVVFIMPADITSKFKELYVGLGNSESEEVFRKLQKKVEALVRGELLKLAKKVKKK